MPKNPLFAQFKKILPRRRPAGPSTNMQGDGLPAEIADLLDAEFDNAFYLDQYGDVSQAEIDPVEHFLKYGWKEGRLPNKWFDGEVYTDYVPELRFSRANPFLHLLTEAAETGLNPRSVYNRTTGAVLSRSAGKGEAENTPVELLLARPARDEMKRCAAGFDEDYYLEMNPDVARSGVDPLLHFMTIGWIEGRDPSPDFSVGYYLRHNTDVRKTGINPLDHYLRVRDKQKWRPSSTVEGAKVLERFEAGGDMEAYVKEAIDLDPMVGFPQTNRRRTSPLDSLKTLTDRVEALRENLGNRRYDYVIAVPHVRISGAARVASIFTRVMSEIVGTENVLVVITDIDDMSHAHWFPQDVDRVNLTEYTDALTEKHRVDLLSDLLRGIDCKVFVNVNSRLAWDALKLYGRQFSQDYRLLTYFFTWDETVDGLRIGYPIQWLRETADFHHVLLADTQNLAQDIRARMGFEESQVRCLYTPVEAPEFEAAHPTLNARPRFLWAGRFDRQKRVDILVDIASANPDMDFDVYGAAVLDQTSIEDYDLPDNLYLKGTYQDLSEVLEMAYDGYLYTSQWDGLPTVLLDMAQAGLPIVAPRVGGIGEVISDETGWLVEDYSDIDGYSAALKEMVALPEEASGRAAVLRKVINEKLSKENFRKVIEEVLVSDVD